MPETETEKRKKKKKVFEKKKKKKKRNIKKEKKAGNKWKRGLKGVPTPRDGPNIEFFFFEKNNVKRNRNEIEARKKLDFEPLTKEKRKRKRKRR